MVQQIRCPSCNRRLQIAEHMLGRPVKCPSCSEKFTAVARGADPAVIPPAMAQADPRAAGFVQADRQGSYSNETHPRTHPERPVGQERPGKVQAIAVMTLVGGILALLGGLGWLIYIGLVGVATLGAGLLCCFWPGPYYSIVLGILAIIKGSALLGADAQLQSAPKGIAIMQIINILNFDVVNLVMGILSLTFISEPEIRRYFRG